MRIDNTKFIGQKYGYLTVLDFYKIKYSTILKCRCDCGNFKDVLRESLTRGLTRSCGCFKENNRLDVLYPNYTRLWNVWYEMKRRCYNPKDNSYKRYGGRGITICNEWLNDFMSFYKWAIDNGYVYNDKERLTIERINNDGNYEPKNCTWKTYKEQSLNTRRNRRFLFNGEMLTIKEISTKLNVKYDDLYNRLLYTNGNIDKAIQKLGNKKKVYSFCIKGENLTFTQISKKYNLDYGKIRRKFYRQGEQAMLDYITSNL